MNIKLQIIQCSRFPAQNNAQVMFLPQSPFFSSPICSASSYFSQIFSLLLNPSLPPKHVYHISPTLSPVPLLYLRCFSVGINNFYCQIFSIILLTLTVLVLCKCLYSNCYRCHSKTFSTRSLKLILQYYVHSSLKMDYLVSTLALAKSCCPKLSIMKRRNSTS
jgi:hypothetical protein